MNPEKEEEAARAKEEMRKRNAEMKKRIEAKRHKKHVHKVESSS